jgi:hypothetical protein
MSHTPGPWAVREAEGDELYEVYREAGGELIAYAAATAKQRVNARLIAAAPELLRELKLMLSLWENASSNYWHAKEYMDMGDPARAAIAKAEGGE